MEILKATTENYSTLKKELDNNNPIIVPTDTNYNLCTFPDSNIGIDRIFQYKKRNKDKPLSLFLKNPNDWSQFGSADNNEIMNILTKNFWPGPLNIIINNLSPYDYMLNGNDTISLGCVENQTLHDFLQYLQSPIAITSANISGTADDTLITIDEAQKHMGNNVNYLLESKTPIKSTMSSTIVKVNPDSISILRQGDLSSSQLKNAFSETNYAVND